MIVRCKDGCMTVPDKLLTASRVLSDLEQDVRLDRETPVPLGNITKELLQSVISILDGVPFENKTPKETIALLNVINYLDISDAMMPCLNHMNELLLTLPYEQFEQICRFRTMELKKSENRE